MTPFRWGESELELSARATGSYSARVLVYAARPSTAVHPVVLQLSCALRDLSRCVGVCLGGGGHVGSCFDGTSH
jgi:hypothetical protein